jgi:hypothetical protein
MIGITLWSDCGNSFAFYHPQVLPGTSTQKQQLAMTALAALPPTFQLFGRKNEIRVRVVWMEQ